MGGPSQNVGGTVTPSEYGGIWALDNQEPCLQEPCDEHACSGAPIKDITI